MKKELNNAIVIKSAVNSSHIFITLPNKQGHYSQVYVTITDQRGNEFFLTKDCLSEIIEHLNEIKKSDKW